MKIFENIDCMEGMKRYTDKYFDLAIVDPPYGINIGGSGTIGGSGIVEVKNYGIKEWDKKIPDSLYFEELKRVSKNQIIFGANYYKMEPTNSWIVWDKKCQNNWNDTFSDGEMAWTSFKKKLMIYRQLWVGALRKSEDKTRSHPTQKPVELYKWIVQNYCESGWIILDTHVGSASSLIAFESFGLDYVGFEIDKDYFEKAKERIEKEREKLNLFNPSFEY